MYMDLFTTGCRQNFTLCVTKLLYEAQPFFYWGSYFHIIKTIFKPETTLLLPFKKILRLVTNLFTWRYNWLRHEWSVGSASPTGTFSIAWSYNLQYTVLKASQQFSHSRKINCLNLPHFITNFITCNSTLQFYNTL